MSYYDNITQRFDNLGFRDKDESRDDGRRDYGYHSEGQGGPPPAQYYASPPEPTYSPPSDKPPIPQGWVARFDQQTQHWFYVEESTGRSQWEAPGYQDESRGFGGESQGGYGGSPGYGAPGGYGGGQGEYGEYREEEKKKSGKGGMLLGAAGGLAVGAIGGALIADALHDSDSEHEHEQYSAPPPAPPADYGYGGGGGYEGGYGGGYGAPPAPEYGYNDYDQGPPDVLPPVDADGDSVSSSDREEVQEAREEYEEALADAYSSDASSSDREELEEAREEYEETYEEVYED